MPTDPILAARAATVAAIHAHVAERATKPAECFLLVGRDILTLLRDDANWRPRTIHDEPLRCECVQVVYRPSLEPDGYELVRIAPLVAKRKRKE